MNSCWSEKPMLPLYFGSSSASYDVGRRRHLALVVDEHGRVPAPRHDQALAARLQRRDLLELGVQVLRDVRDRLEVDRLDHPLLHVAHRPEAVGLEEVVLRGARKLELRERLGVAAHADVVDADARRIEERLDAGRLHVAAPGEPVDGAGSHRAARPATEGSGGAESHAREGSLLQEIAPVGISSHVALPC
jgi:hypothetical protein